MTFLILFNTRTPAVKLKGRTCCNLLRISSRILQKMMTSSLEIQFKHKFAINLYTMCISLGIISSICCGCSGKQSLLVCFLTTLIWPAFVIDVFTAPKNCLHERARGWLGFFSVPKSFRGQNLNMVQWNVLHCRFFRHCKQSKMDYLPWCLISIELDWSVNNSNNSNEEQYSIWMSE